MESLSGKVAVVTGGASGIGLATAVRLSAEGMSVVIADVDEASLQRAVATVTASGGTAVAVPTDVAGAGQIEALADATIDRFGGVHVAFLNAGVVVGGRIDHLTEEEWRWVVEVNLWGVIRGVRTFLPIIEQQGEGHLVATSSTSGVGAPVFNGPYAASKAGVIAVMETLRRELEARESPIGASVLIPGPVRTDLVRSSAARAAETVAGSVSPSGNEFRATAHTLLQNAGIAPALVAEMVVDAVKTNRFWVMTHPEWAEVIRERAEAMVTTGDLTARAPRT